MKLILKLSQAMNRPKHDVIPRELSTHASLLVHFSNSRARFLEPSRYRARFLNNSKTCPDFGFHSPIIGPDSPISRYRDVGSAQLCSTHPNHTAARKHCTGRLHCKHDTDLYSVHPLYNHPSGKSTASKSIPYLYSPIAVRCPIVVP
jgi:hypothetical protein